MKSTLRFTGLVVAGIFLALHLPYLPLSLEDLDSINFALGIGDYDVARHQPHPPGYPLYIAAAKLLHAVGLTEVRALALLAMLGGAAALIALAGLVLHLDEEGDRDTTAWFSVPMVALNPLYWLTASRPLSDTVGLAASLAVQLALVRAHSARALAVAAGVAGLAAGLRSQVVWLTLPLLLLAAARLPASERRRGTVRAAIAYVVGGLCWGVPLLAVSGGPLAYWRAVSDQGTEDLTGVTLLANTPTIRQAVLTFEQAFVAPWDSWLLASAVLLLAVVGLALMLRSARGALLTLVVAFVPYAVFDLLFQEAITTRYALPLVIPVVYLAGRGLSWLPGLPAVLVALGIAGVSVMVDDGVLYAYARSEAPVFRMLGDMQAVEPGGDGAVPVFAMHRRLEFDLRRPLQWVGSRVPTWRTRLPATAKHEWLELVKYWNGGGRDPVWFVADPLRSDLALIGRSSRPTLYRWHVVPKGLLGGARPGEMDWHRIDPPDWYLGEGWALTPETAGLAREDGRGPAEGGSSGWFRRWRQPVTLMIGGRNMATDGASAQVRISIDGQPLEPFVVAPGFFLRMLTVPAVVGEAAYVALTAQSNRRDLAIEQFDIQPTGRVVYGFAEGWNEQEYNPATGVLWRWSSDRSLIRVRAEGHAVALTLRGELEAASSSHVVVRAGERIVQEFEVGRTFSRTVLVPADALAGEEATIAIESSASYVPAETRWRSNDRRRLGLKLFECRVTPAS